MKQYRIIIAGGRDFDNQQYLTEVLSNFLAGLGNPESVEIVSGKASGADRQGEIFAKGRSIPVKEFPADWKTYGNYAGPRRNMQMAEYASHLIAFYDGSSRGTGNMIHTAKDLGLTVSVYYFNIDGNGGTIPLEF